MSQFGQYALPLEIETDGFSAPAFSRNVAEPVHRWVNWIAGFSAAFVRDCIERYEPGREGVILDPFAGVATTNIEALIAGHNTVGFEVNPFAAFVANTKLTALRTDPNAILGLSRRFSNCMRDALDKGREPRSCPPPMFRSRIPFFSAPVLHQVLLALDFIDELEEPVLRDLTQVALGATMVSFSNYTYEPSLGTRPGAGKPLIENASVGEIIARKLSEMGDDIRSVQRARGNRWGRGVIHQQSFFTCIEEGLLEAGSVSLLVTSPPYLNNYHYVRNTRPQLFWLGLVQSRDELKQLEENSYGKFWQTVRAQSPIDLEFDLPEAKAIVHEIRQQRTDKGIYGGPGWANYATCYLNDSWRFIQLVGELLQPGGVAIIVVGNHIIQGVHVEIDKFLALMAERIGLQASIHLLREKRVGDSITNSSVRRGRAEVSLYEAAVELRKAN